MNTAEPLTRFTALHAEADDRGITLSGKIGGDVALVLDDTTPAPPDPQLTTFSLQRYPGGPGSHPIDLWRRLAYDELAQIVAALDTEAHKLPPGLDAGLFHAFLAHARLEVSRQPSSRFTDARFGDIARAPDGAIVAHYGIGVDVAGTVHDAAGRITAEQHVVPMTPGRFRRLSRSDRLSLAAAIDRFVQTAPPPVSPLWAELAADAGR
jgi:hypothetical protein